ncbi:MAG TPA: hypothetical protein VGA13_06225 [Acidimicrobiales bacterium]|jgi:hypothetical protein
MADPTARFVLEPDDEYPHQPEAAPNYNESMYLNVFDHTRAHGGWFRLGNRVNEGYAEMSVCTYLADGRVGFMFGRPAISSNDAMDAGGLTIEVLEPLHRLRVTYAGKLCLLDHPEEMADPRTAFTTNPHVEATASLEFEGVSKVFGGSFDAGTAESGFAKAHYEQHVRADGHITVGDEVMEMTGGLGLRDKSWGPRSWQSIDWYRWLPIAFGPDLGMTVSLRASGDHIHRGVGMVHHDGHYETFTGADIETTWDRHGHPATVRVDARTPSRRYEITGEVLSCIPLRHRRQRDDGVTLQTRIAEGFTRFTLDGRVGYGMSEYLDQMIDGMPTGPDAAEGGDTGRVGTLIST